MTPPHAAGQRYCSSCGLVGEHTSFTGGCIPALNALLRELKEAQLKGYHSMLDDMLVLLAEFHYPTPEKTYKADGGWALAISDMQRCLREKDERIKVLETEVQSCRKALDGEPCNEDFIREADKMSKFAGKCMDERDALQQQLQQAQAECERLRKKLAGVVEAVQPFVNGIVISLERAEIEPDDQPTNISIEWNTSYMSAHDLIEALAKAKD